MSGGPNFNLNATPRQAAREIRLSDDKAKLTKKDIQSTTIKVKGKRKTALWK